MTKVGHPAHMHKTLRYLAQGRMQHLWPYVFEEMLNQGVLQEPTASQQKAIATLYYIPNLRSKILKDVLKGKEEVLVLVG